MLVRILFFLGRLLVIIMVRSIDRLMPLLGNVQTMKPRRPILLPARRQLARRHQFPHLQKQVPNQILQILHRIAPLPLPARPGGLITVCPGSAKTTSQPTSCKIALAIITAIAGDTTKHGGIENRSDPSNNRVTLKSPWLIPHHAAAPPPPHA